MSSTPQGAHAARDAAAARAIVLALIAVHASLSAWLALARYASVHNHTFDLALYARMAWGLAHNQAWDPVVGGSFLGGHLALVLAPLGWLGWLIPLVPLLLIAQSCAVALAAWPLSRFAARHLGSAGAVLAALVWLLYPNLAHVASYEFHPGTLGLLPLCCALDRFDRAQPRGLALFCLAAVACRASLALQTCALGLLAAFSVPALRRTGWSIAIASLAYFALAQFVLQPRFGQVAQASADLHFARWGGSPLGVLPALVRTPAAVLAHFAAPERLRYLVIVLAPLGLLPLARPRYLWVAAPPLALNLLSEFPTASTLYSHYLTPAVPALAFAAIEGLAALLVRAENVRASRAIGFGALLGCAAIGNALAAGLPWSRDFVASDFRADSFTKSAWQALALIGRQASVQAPDALLPHLAERTLVARVPPPERVADFVVFDVRYRRRFAMHEDLLRTLEEPLLRSWLARTDHGVVFADPELLVLRRGISPRTPRVQRYFAGTTDPESGVTLTDCLASLGAELRGTQLTLQFVARSRCPHDLAVRLGVDDRPPRVDLLFDGVLSPAHVIRGDLLQSIHAVSPAERRAFEELGLRVGLLRSSGARPRPSDPISVRVPLHVVP
jgi:uncharacterized membrane protein